MENQNVQNKRDINLPFIVFSAIFGALALSAIIIFWIDKDAEWVEVYQMAVRWLVLPICSLVASYVGTLKKAPKGLMWLCPVAFGVGMSVVEWATYGSFSIVLLVMGALASLFGFTFAKMDRAEKARAAKAEKIRAAMESGEELEKHEVKAEEDENPHPDFIPDEDDTWADEVIAKEGFGDIKVDYAESDPDFSIDAPDEAASEEVVEDAEGGETLDEEEESSEGSAEISLNEEDAMNGSSFEDEDYNESEREETMEDEPSDLGNDDESSDETEEASGSINDEDESQDKSIESEEDLEE